MKNLIEEIEKLKNNKKAFSERGYSDNECYAYRSAIKDTLSILNQYNLITAPKNIKLSEIVSKLASELEDEYEEEIYYNKDIKCIGFGEYDKDWFQNTWFTLVRFNKDFSIRDINLPLDFNFKWLYTLWIAGTEIVDDLECDE